MARLSFPKLNFGSGARLGLLVTQCLALCVCIAVIGSYIWIMTSWCKGQPKPEVTGTETVLFRCSMAFKAIWSFILIFSILQQIIGWAFFCHSNYPLIIAHCIIAGVLMVFFNIVFILHGGEAFTSSRMGLGIGVIGFNLNIVIMIMCLLLLISEKLADVIGTGTTAAPSAGTITAEPTTGASTLPQPSPSANGGRSGSDGSVVSTASIPKNEV